MSSLDENRDNSYPNESSAFKSIFNDHVVFEVEEEVVEVPSKRSKRLTSVVWEDFNKLKEGDKEIAICKHCKRRFTGASTSGTSHLKNHSDRCPLKTVGNPKQLLLSTTNTKKCEGNLVPFKYEEGNSREKLTRMIIRHEFPFSIVEYDGVREFVQSLQPTFKMMSRVTAKSDCVKMYGIEKKKLYNKFDKFSSRVNITTDMWTSCQNLGYMCVTVHYIDDSWVLHKNVINFCKVDPPHNAETLFRMLMGCLMEWNLDSKLFTITMDNCSTNDRVAEKLKERLSEKNMFVCEGKFVHVRCAAHILNLIVQDGLSEIREVIHKIRESVKFVKSSQGREKKFNDCAIQARIQCKKSLCLDVPTRWNSTFLMLEVAIEYKDAFWRLIERDPSYGIIISEVEWKKATSIKDCLKLFFEASNVFLGSKYPTSNLYFPEVCDIHLHLVKWSQSLDADISAMAYAMKTKFDKYWRICSLVLAVAAILDPRFKMSLLQMYYTWIYGFSSEEKVNEVVQCMREMYNEYVSVTRSNSDNVVNDSQGSGSTTQVIDTAASFDRRSWFKTYKTFIQTTRSDQLKSDLEMYLDAPIEDLEETQFDILHWWRNNAAKYPTLGKMARDLLVIPVSTVASESTFSTSGRVLDPYRSSLNPETVQALICTQDWIRDDSRGQPNLTALDSSSSSLNYLDDSTLYSAIAPSIGLPMPSLSKD